MDLKKIIKWSWFPILLLVLAAWFYAPVTFLKDVPPERVAGIRVFDGNTGEELEITGGEEIRHIVENLRSVRLRRSGISLLHAGYRFRMTFLDAEGGVLEELTVNSETTIRRDPFFYTSEAGGLCYDYLWGLMDAEHGYIRAFAP